MQPGFGLPRLRLKIFAVSLLNPTEQTLDGLSRDGRPSDTLKPPLLSTHCKVSSVQRDVAAATSCGVVVSVGSMPGTVFRRRRGILLQQTARREALM